MAIMRLLFAIVVLPIFAVSAVIAAGCDGLEGVRSTVDMYVDVATGRYP